MSEPNTRLTINNLEKDKDEEFRTGEIVTLPNDDELSAMMNHATMIQASWRGRQTRKTFHGSKDKNLQYDPNAIKLKSIDGHNVNAFGVAIDDKGELDETLLQKYTRVKFENINKIQFYVDGAINLPCNCTTTRVTTKLVNVNMKQVGELSEQDFSSLDSEFTDPDFNSSITWPVDLKDMPSLTIVCRIDTLERPTMKPRVVGYAALKLCLDTNNDGQPTLHESGQYYFNISDNQMRGGDHLVLNSGEYLIPLVHGVVPLQREFNEELMENLTPIPGSQLRVRLFDPTKDKGNKIIDQKIKSKKVLINSVASIVLSSYLGDFSKFPILNNARDTFTQLLKVEKLNDINQTLLKSLKEWISLRFPLPSDMREVINPRRMMRYNPVYGAMSSLDMMYNLPTIVNDSSEWVKDNLNKKNLGCASCFKSVFKYLPGSDCKVSSNNNINSDPFSEIFDVSCIWSMNQPEACPTYKDGFCTSANLQLSSNACILVVVNSVDVYTPPLKTKTFDELINITTTVAQSSNTNESDRKKSLKSASMIVKNNLNLKKKSKSLPKGVADINIISEDDSTWWGLLPLFSKSTFQNPSDSPFFKDDINSYFVDEGTHQIPLFKGKPPDSIIYSSAPFLSLLDLLNKQWVKELPTKENSLSKNKKPIKSTIALEKQLKSSKTSKRQTLNAPENFIDIIKSSNLANKFFNVFGKSIEPSPIEIPITKDTIVLSEGASAFIRIVDSSCKGFANQHMNDDGSRIILRYETMKKIFRYSRGIKDSVANPIEMLENENNFNELIKLFRYESLRFENNRLLRESFPIGMNHSELLDTVNDQYEELMDC
jgi:hypothetical protein